MRNVDVQLERAIEAAARYAEQGRRQEQARAELRAWADMVARRDELIRHAVALGISRREVQRLTGVARTTIDRILDRAPEADRP